MDRRLRVLTWVLAAVSLASISVAGQAQSTWTAPKTPWGDPDVQGFFTNNDESGIPLERPDGFEGKGLDEVTDQELAELTEERNQRAEDRAALLGGLPGSNPVHWFENFGAQNSRAWLIVDPPDGRVPPMTAEAGRRPQGRGGSSFGNGPFDGPEDLSMYDRCITRGLPGSMMPAIYGNQFQIVQAPGSVAILYEMIHETRVIALDGRSPIASGIGLDMGDGRGRWDDDTLVVTTKNFKERSVYRNANPDTLTLTERFTRISPTQVRWSVTVDDPSTWTRPWTFSLPLTADPNPLPLYECHEGNYGLKNILSAARAEERAK